jgi:hypothetical protein
MHTLGVLCATSPVFRLVLFEILWRATDMVRDVHPVSSALSMSFPWVMTSLPRAEFSGVADSTVRPRYLVAIIYVGIVIHYYLSNGPHQQIAESPT